MPFKKGQSGNPLGRIPKQEKLTAKQIKDKELSSLLRKLKPIQAKAIQAAAKIIDNEDSTENAILKASALIISTYIKLVDEVYGDGDYEEGNEPKEIQESAPAFSLKMVNKPEDNE